MAGMCDTCHAGCCRAYNLLITAYDALHISRELSLPVGEFSTMLAFSTEQAKRFETTFVPIRFSDPGCEHKRFFLGLKRIESRIRPGTVRCYFLNEWERENPAPQRDGHPGQKLVGRCSIYTLRPMMCRTYPTSLASGAQLGFISTPRPVDLQSKDDIYTLCPGNWSAEAFSTDHTTVLHNLVINRFEMDFYNQAVAQFNKQPRPVKDFFPFMLRAYENRFRSAPAQAAQPAPVAQVAPAVQAAVQVEEGK